MLFWAGCGTDKGSGPKPPVFVLNVDTATVEVSTSYQFIATADGESTGALWYVEGLRGGTPSMGMITCNGLFVAPPQIPTLSGKITVTAKWIGDTTVVDSAILTISKPPDVVFVGVTPGNVKLRPDSSVKFTAFVHNCFPEDVTWSIAKAYGKSDNIGDIAEDGTYTAPSLSSTAKVIVMARSNACPNKIGIAAVEVEGDVGIPFTVELEKFNQSENKGGNEIRSIPCGAASGKYSVEGLDYSGDRIWVPLTVPKSGKYRLSVRYAAPVGSVINVRVTIEGCGEGLTEDYSLTEGTGVG